MTRLRAADIAAGYENKKIIENMSVTIPEGKITSLIGPNGSGKSTLLKSFTRILPVKSGKIIVNNSDISTYSSKELAKKISKIINYPIEESIGYPTPGSFGTYVGIERNIPTITLEMDEEETIENLYIPIKEIFDML